ncbi:conjugative transposon protein TraM [Leeuwenhoekiella sp. A16]|uniref:conjugative transposon protein TraM n=1 Tax=unclassified Leeuwenhoekiella TaxID=2615029 RepID=UPI003A8125F8
MKVEKNKIVFAAVLAVIVLFLIAYSLTLMDNKEGENENLEQVLVPEIEENQKQYDTKLDAVNDLKELRENNIPSIYDEKLIDSLGYYDRNLPEQEKERLADSIYSGTINYFNKSYEHVGEGEPFSSAVEEIDSTVFKREQVIQARELGLEHQLFFAAAPKANEISGQENTEATIYAVVDGDQVVKANSRLRLRLSQAAVIQNKRIPKHTLIFGFISFQPNRALIEIENINHLPTHLKAFDIQDGSEGIYVENNFRAEATHEVVDDMISDINIPSVPQVSGITKVLKRNNRNVKVTILNNYKLILKPKL